MGGAISAMGSGLSKVFSNAGDMVKGTGQTVGELKNIGRTPKEMASMGLQAEPSKGVAFARDALRGALQKGGQALQAQRGPQGGAPVQFNTSQPQLPDDLLWPSDPRRRMMVPQQGSMDPTMFYGG